jgi:hypothetical protein
MRTEVEQPMNIKRPSEEDPLRWASLGRVHSLWAREVCPQLGLDASKVILGATLRSIAEDDENAFGLIATVTPETIAMSKALIFIRMDFEKELIELPQNIRIQISKVQKKLEDAPWADESNYFMARSIWLKEVRDFTRNQIALHKSLQQAVAYGESTALIWSPYWQEFLKK